MSFHQWHSILLFFHSLKVLYDLVSAYCISLDKLELHTPYLHSSKCVHKRHFLQNLKGRSEAAARVLLPFEGWCRGPRYCGNLCTLSPWSGSLCQCAMIIGVGQLFHLPVDLLQPLSQISVYPCVKEPALSRRDPHNQSWRIEDEKLTQVLVGPHGFQLIFLDFSLALLFPAQPCSQFPTLLKANSYLRGTVFIETL